MQDKEAEAAKLHRAAVKVAQQEKLAEDRALKTLLQSADGRTFLWYLLTIGKHGVQPFTGVASTTDFSCGEMNVGQQIFARIIETEPTGYLQMLNDRIENDRARNTPDRTDPANDVDA